MLCGCPLLLHQFSPDATDRALCSLFGYIWQKLGSSIKQVIATVQTPLIHSRRECYILKQVLSFQMSPSMSPNVTFLDFFCNDSLKLYVMFAELPGRSSIMFHFKIRC